MPGKKKFIFIHYVVLNIGGGPQSHVPVVSLSGATFLSIPNSALIYVNFALSLITLWYVGETFLDTTLDLW